MAAYLGLFDGHNAAASLFFNGRIQKAVQEERLTGIKDFYGPPEKAVREVMSLMGLHPSDVDRVCVASKYVSLPRPPKSAKAAFDNRYHRNLRQQALRTLASTGTYRNFRARQRMQQRAALVEDWGFSRDRVEFFDHHQTHAASAYFGLRKDDSPYLVLTLDGGGDRLSGSVWVGASGELKKIAMIPQEDSLGEIYAVTTHLLGFMPLEHEYKLMGMAPYASEEHAKSVAGIFRTYLDLDEKNPLRFKRKVPEPLAWIGPRLQRDLERMRFDSICAGLQLFTENAIVRWVRACIDKTEIRRVLAAGGVFMNVKANKAISELDGVEYFEAFPSSGDESLVFGTCYLAARSNGEEVLPLEHCYLGNDLTEDECRKALSNFNEFEIEEPGDMGLRIAEMLASGEIVARASGPMEFGARALGNRSILADPINQDVVRIINRMIKNRDFWMPFAPVVMRRESSQYFANPKSLPSPYMMNTFSSTDKRDEFMAAVHNADLTARPQLLEQGQNGAYEEILHHFGRMTGRHVLLNTSFNLHGYPVVCRAADAVHVMLNSGLNNLALGPYLVTKRKKEGIR